MFDNVGFHYMNELKQIQKVIGYCKKHDIDINNISFRQFIELNNKFQRFDWISLEYLECLKNHETFSLQKIYEKVNDKYKKVIEQNEKN